MPKVSLVIPTFNCEQYLSEAIESVLNQTYCDFEILVVDDGSTDNTRAKIERYKSMIRYIPQNNQGPSAARNLGIRHSNGKYIGFLDADDLWFPEKLKLQVDYLEQVHDVGLVTCDALSFKDNTILVPSMAEERKLHSGWVLKYLLRENFLNTNNVLIKRDVFEKVGFFDEHRKFSEDYDLWLRIAKYYKIGYVDQVLTKYRIHNKNRSLISREAVEKAHLELVLKYLKDGRFSFFQRRAILAHNYFKYGYNYFYDQEYLKARNLLKMSILSNPFNLKAYVYLFSSLFPKKIINKVKIIKRQLFSRKNDHALGK